MAPQPDTALNSSRLPANATLYLIRHAEKPDSGTGLSPAGEARARAYVDYLQSFTNPSGQPLRWDYLFASQDSEASQRPVLTITPLAAALGKPIDQSYADGHYLHLVQHLGEHAHRYGGANILICWHHGEVLDLAAALGASPATLPPASAWPAHWPGSVFGWVLQIYLDDQGKLHHHHTRAINERLMPDDTTDPVYGH